MYEVSDIYVLSKKVKISIFQRSIAHSRPLQYGVSNRLCVQNVHTVMCYILLPLIGINGYLTTNYRVLILMGTLRRNKKLTTVPTLASSFRSSQVPINIAVFVFSTPFVDINGQQIFVDLGLQTNKYLRAILNIFTSKVPINFKCRDIILLFVVFNGYLIELKTKIFLSKYFC